MLNTKLFPLVLNLMLFSDGGDGGTGADGATGENATAAVSQKGVKTDTNGVQTADAQIDSDKEFEELIKGKFKANYESKVQDILQKRLKGVKDVAAKYESLAPTLEMLGKKYGVNIDDVDALNKAIAEDDSYYEDEALELGIPVEQLKNIRRIERENTSLKKQVNEHNARERAAQRYSTWMGQAQDTAKMYPSFNLEQELQNQRFVDLLNSNIDVRTAYEVLHRDEIIPAAMQVATKKAKEQISNDIAANRARASENGTHSTTLAKSDVSRLSYDEIDEINRKVLRGERYQY